MAYQVALRGVSNVFPAVLGSGFTIGASEKKLALPLPHTSSTDIAVSPLATDEACSSSSGMKGLRLIDLDDLLASVTRRANCNVCGSGLTVRESLKNRKGLCPQLTLSCTNPSCIGVEEALSNPCKHSKAWNSRFILAGKMCGRGSAGLETICGVMGLPPPVSSKSYSEHNNFLIKYMQQICEESFRSASAQLRQLQGAGPDDVVDVTVTCDGPWSRRGFVANCGVIAVLSWETGQVLDEEVLSKSCNNIIWSRWHKTGFCSRVSAEIAVYLAVTTFNHGLEGL